MASDEYNYPEDEFDVLGQNRTPQATHRAPRSWLQVWGPLIAVLVVVPLVAIGLVRLATQDSSESPSTPAPSAEVSEDPATAPAETDPETPVEEPTPEVEPTPEETTPEAPPLDQTVAVAVLNGAGVQGLATTVSDRLAAAGWTGVTAGNYQSAQPEVSTVYYNNAELAAAAQAVATELGIANVTELADVPSITVVLRSDFAG